MQSRTLIPSVTFFPLHAIEGLETPSHVISIGDKLDSEPAFRVDHLSVFTITNWRVDTLIALIEYVKEHVNDPIIVHCIEGRVRSATVAYWISKYVGTHRLELDTPGCRGTTAGLDGVLLRNLLATYQKQTKAP